MFIGQKFAIFLIINAAIAVAYGQPLFSPIVTTKTGQLRGQLVTLAPLLQVYQFTAIPFAEPPTGMNRFKKSVPKLPWEGILDATKVPNVCHQIPILAIDPRLRNITLEAVMKPKGIQSEDCLYLNIWAPKPVLDQLATGSSNPQKLAVFAFIHGGGFMVGSSSIALYNGAVLAGYNNIIVVTIQYRLGTLGFAYWPEQGIPGNMGLWDQLEALRWISDNIEAFGGNPNEVAIAGESAGAGSVTLHLLSPYSRQYFQRAIVESGSAVAFWGVRTPETAKFETNKTFNTIFQSSCNQTQEMLDCLLSVNASAFLVAMLPLPGAVIGPVVDGDFVPRHPLEMLQSGDFYQVPLLIGANKDEGSVFLMGAQQAKLLLPFETGANEVAMIDRLNFTDYADLLTATLNVLGIANVNPLLLRILQLQYWPNRHEGYPVGREVVESAVAATGDVFMICPTYRWATIASRFDEMGSKIFAYYFTQPRSTNRSWPSWLGVMHTNEIPFVFGEPFARDFGYSNEDKALSRVMMAYWTNFAKFGDPNIRDPYSFNLASGPLQLRNWPPFVGPTCPAQIANMNSAVQVSNYSPAVICGLKSRECMFWDELFPALVQVLATAANTTESVI